MVKRDKEMNPNNEKLEPVTVQAVHKHKDSGEGEGVSDSLFFNCVCSR
jgi:hypothetical protein